MSDSQSTDVRLVTRGDDAALAESANEAIRECFESGVLRNVSVMAPCPALDHAAAELADVGLCVGVHVTLASEWDAPSWGPVLPADEVPSLVDDDGDFYRTPEELFERDPALAEIRAEMEAQLERLRDVGFTVAYADGHMLPQRYSDEFADEFAAFCAREGLVDGTRVSHLPEWTLDTGPEWLLDQLDGLPSGTYLVVGHPAYDDAEMRDVVGMGRSEGELGAARADQRRTFTDERVSAYVHDNDVELLRYDEL